MYEMFIILWVVSRRGVVWVSSSYLTKSCRDSELSQEARVTSQRVGCRPGARIHQIHLWASGNWPLAGSLCKLVYEIMINVHI